MQKTADDEIQVPSIANQMDVTKNRRSKRNADSELTKKVLRMLNSKLSDILNYFSLYLSIVGFLTSSIIDASSFNAYFFKDT